MLVSDSTEIYIYMYIVLWYCIFAYMQGAHVDNVLLVIKRDVWFPDSVDGHSYAGGIAIVFRLPYQSYVSPKLARKKTILEYSPRELQVHVLLFLIQ